jgi:hypothetical protein
MRAKAADFVISPRSSLKAVIRPIDFFHKDNGTEIVQGQCF